MSAPLYQYYLSQQDLHQLLPILCSYRLTQLTHTLQVPLCRCTGKVRKSGTRATSLKRMCGVVPTARASSLGARFTFRTTMEWIRFTRCTILRCAPWLPTRQKQELRKSAWQQAQVAQAQVFRLICRHRGLTRPLTRRDHSLSHRVNRRTTERRQRAQRHLHHLSNSTCLLHGLTHRSTRRGRSPTRRVSRRTTARHQRLQRHLHRQFDQVRRKL